MLKARRSAGGFTIIEVTIALALIMGGMVFAMTAINSRLRQENFYWGIGRFTSVIDDIMNDVSTNNWPHVSGWRCQLKPGDPNQLEFVPDAGHETGEGNCLHVGKVIQFGDDRTIAEDDGDYYVHTIVTHKNSLIPIYNFDKTIGPLGPGGFHALTTLEESTPPPGFSTRDNDAWPHGIQINQAYYLEGGTTKVYLRGLAIIQQSAHGLQENDLLLHSGASNVAVRVVIDRDTTQSRLPSQSRLDADNFAQSLERRNHGSEPSGTNLSDFKSDYDLPIYICLSDGRGNRVLGLLGGQVSGLLIQTEFDLTEINTHCS